MTNTNTLTVFFLTCTPAPANGYTVKYRKKGDTGAYVSVAGFTESPAIIEGIVDNGGQNYEGFIFSDCGLKLGKEIPFLTSALPACIPVDFLEISLNDAKAAVPYSAYVTLFGDPPFTIEAITKPSWLTVDIFSSYVYMTGTPPDVTTGENIVFTIKNCGGTSSKIYSGILITVASCREYYNNTGNPLINVNYQPCGSLETLFHKTVFAGDSICCASPPVGGDGGLLTDLGTCY